MGIKERISVSPHGLNKLTLVMTEACNLRCVYCYEESWQGKKKGNMTPENAKEIIRRIFSQVSQCNMIQFFGGEPTLNLSAIESVMNEVYCQAEKGSVESIPRVGLVTNGVWKNVPGTMDIIKRFNVETTVSIDGPADIHDSLRPFIRGESSHSRAVDAISRLQDAGMPVAIESVYTTHHMDKGVSIVDMFEYSASLGVRKYFFDIAYPPANSMYTPFNEAYFGTLLDYYLDAVDWWFSRLLANDKNILHVFFKDLLVPLLEGEPGVDPVNGCPAGTRDYAIGPNGDVSVCHLLYGMTEYTIGNILRDEIYEQTSRFPVGSNEIKECKQCYARHWCQPCAGLNQFWGDAWRPSSAECMIRKTVITRLAEWAFACLEVPINDHTQKLLEVVGAFRKERVH